MRFIAFLILAVCLVTANAHDVYRWIAPDGSVHFSDQPRAGATIIRLPDWPTPLPRRQALPPTTRATGRSVSNVYDKLTIIKPKSEENVRDNEGNVDVILTLVPDLKTTADHKIQLLLDGQVHGEPADSLEQSLKGVERGYHTVTARVINKQGQVLMESRPVSFYLKHASPLFHPPRPGTPYKGVQQAPRAPMAPRAPRAPHAPFRPAVPPPPVPR